jgi:hypothetical protein
MSNAGVGIFAQRPEQMAKSDIDFLPLVRGG